MICLCYNKLMEKFKYQKVEDYEIKKKSILSAIQNENGGVLPLGYDNDMFLSALIKIIDHLENNYKTIILAQDIPDVKKFTRQKEEYSITSFVLNRVLKNVKSVNFRDVDKNKPHMMGGYTSYKDGTHDITLYTTVMQNNLNFLKSRAINKKFATDEDFEKTLLEETMIHELIHAISDNGLAVGFDKNKNLSAEIALNEGMTENLALEIAGLRDFSNTLYKSGEYDFAIKTQTNSGYMLETNIFNLIRVASKQDMTIPYLTDIHNIRFGADREIYGQSNSLDAIQTLLGIAKEDAEQNDFLSFQALQSILIEDIFKNKYDKCFLDKIRQNGNAPTQKEYDKLKEDILIIGRSLVSTLAYKLDAEEKKEFAQNNSFASSKDIMELIQNKTIEPSPNVLRYKDLLFAMENIQKDFANELTI